MKTFEEALATVVVSASDEELTAVAPAVVDKALKYSSLAEEIGGNKKVHDMIHALLESQEGEPACSLMTAAFINGVIVGIEMEKSE